MGILTALSISLIACAPVSSAGDTAAGTSSDPIILLERGALDRWGKGDPQGYITIMESGVTYFDPLGEARVDGREALTAAFAPFTGRIHIDHYEMLKPRVQHYGDVAVLTFNLIDEVKEPPTILRWNATEVYHRVNGTWRIVHSHWSYVRPSLNPPSN
jgi:ketosteroid isomerase-like protein